MIWTCSKFSASSALRIAAEQALGITQLQIGQQIDPGVPWCYAHTSAGGLHITLKSGNFGSEDFFVKAFHQLANAATL